MLTYATPKKTNYLRVISPISKNSWAYNPQVKPYEYSQQAAVAILDRLTEANANFHLEIELTTTPGHATLGQSIIDSWEALGISAKLKIVSFPDTNDYQILLIGQQIPKDPDQYALWHSTQSTNITKYQNPKIDKLLEDGRQEADPEKRKLIYQDFQRFLVEDSPVAFLHNLEVYHLYRQ
jgi:peptide/nickel transport system substrate-binding protein